MKNNIKNMNNNFAAACFAYAWFYFNKIKLGEVVYI